MNIDRAKSCLTDLSLADHLGDVNRELPDLCRALDLPAPVWSNRTNGYIMAWDLDEAKADAASDGYDLELEEE